MSTEDVTPTSRLWFHNQASPGRGNGCSRNLIKILTWGYTRNSPRHLCQPHICNSIFPSIVQLTFLHQHICSQGLRSWLWNCHFPLWCGFCPYIHVSALHTEVIVQWHKMHHKECPELGMGYHLCHLSDVLLQYKLILFTQYFHK